MDFQKLARDVAAPIVAQLVQLELALTRGHLPDIDGTEPFCYFGSGSVPALGSLDVLTIEPRARTVGVLTGLANQVDDGGTWADGTPPAGGIFFQVLVGGRVRNGLDRLNSPFGFVGNRGALVLPFYAEPVIIRARNLHATDAMSVCVQTSGHFEPVKGGPRLEGVGAGKGAR